LGFGKYGSDGKRRGRESERGHVVVVEFEFLCILTYISNQLTNKA